MTNDRHHSTPPPRVAGWLLELFLPGDRAQAILGDLLEEFSAMASRRGVEPARRWYWRQSAKTIPHLLGAELSLAPWRNLAAITAGLLLLWLANMLLVTGAAGLHYPAEWPEPVRLAWLACVPLAPLAGLILPPMLIGGMVASVSKRREMAVAILLGLAISALRTIALFLFYGPVSGIPPARSLFWLADPLGIVVCPIAILVGGLIGRKISHDWAPC